MKRLFCARNLFFVFIFVVCNGAGVIANQTSIVARNIAAHNMAVSEDSFYGEIAANDASAVHDRNQIAGPANSQTISQTVVHDTSLDTAYDERQAIYQHVECTFEPINSTKDTALSHPHIPGSLPAWRRSPQSVVQSSTNWAGYVAVSNITNPVKNSVTKVAGSWIVPTITIAKNNSYSAFWIGIDGYSNGTVEQIGTAHDSSSGVVQHYAWFEMYPGGSYSINGFPLAVGDTISATITYTGNGIFVMSLYNNTKKVFVTIPTAYTKSITAQRSSAEWIVEAPYLNGILPLANFGTAHLSGCTATINGVNHAIGLFPVIDLNMVTTKGAFKAVTSNLLTTEDAFSVAWKGQ